MQTVYFKVSSTQIKAQTDILLWLHSVFLISPGYSLSDFDPDFQQILVTDDLGGHVSIFFNAQLDSFKIVYFFIVCGDTGTWVSLGAVSSSEAGVVDGCEFPMVGASNWTRGLCKSSKLS